MNYRQFLFEAAIDAWLKKNTELSQEEKLKAQIIFKDLQSKYVEHLDPKAKNLVPLSFQTLELLYLSIQKAIIKNLLPTTIQWLTREIVSGEVSSLQNVEEDYIPPLKIYQDNSEILPLLKDVPNISELNKILNALEPEQRELAPESDLGKIAEMDGWSLYMPHTTAASCELGKTGGKRDTSWCTTVTKGRNLYLHYTGTFNKNYTLFYIIKRGVNAEKHPFAKMSIGTFDDEILFDQGDGNVTVNADNKNLTEKKFREVLGDETAVFFLDKIREIIDQSEFKHPMKVEMERLATDPKLFLKKLEPYGESAEDLELRYDLVMDLLKYKNISPEVLKIIAQIPNFRIREHVAVNPNTPPEVLAKFAVDGDRIVREYVAQNLNTPPEALAKLATDESIYIRCDVAQNLNTLSETLEMMSQYENHKDVLVCIAENPNTPPEIAQKLKAKLGLKESRKPKKISLSSIIFRN